MSKVSDDFVSCWTQCYNSDFYKEMQPDKHNKIWIKDKRIANEIRRDYKAFQSSKLSLEEYLNRTILYGSYTRDKAKIFIRAPENDVKSTPIFLIHNRDKRTLTGWTINDLNSRQAIKMKTKFICKLYNRHIISVDLDNPPDYIERDALADLDDVDGKFGYDRTQKQKIKFHLQKYLTMCCYAFNGGKLIYYNLFKNHGTNSVPWYHFIE